MLKKRIFYIVLIIIAVGALLGSGFAFGFTLGKKYPQNLVVKGVANVANEGTNADFSTFWQTWSLVNDYYLRNSSTTNQQKVYGAAAGLVASLGDPYTVFFNPDENKKFEEDVQGNFGGIGAEIGLRKNQLVVIAPLKDSPAMRAGIKAGDAILKIDATSTDGLSIEQAVGFIRGVKGTSVTLTTFRDGLKKPQDVTVVRDTIEAPTLDFEMKGKVAYVQLYGFNTNSDRLFLEAMKKAQAANAQGLVLDLRNDPGGYLDVAVDLAGWFVKKGTLVVSEADKTGITDELRANGNEALVNIPTAVIMNKGSASAAEILAGTLRDNKHIPLVGEQSFGKGTVQKLVPLADGSSIKVTIAHWVLPSGTILDHVGLKPDEAVTLSEDDVAKHLDPQLDKALEIVNKQIR